MSSGTNEEPTESKAKHRAFVISPIGAKGSEVNQRANLALTYIFKKALDSSAWEVRRADEGEKPDSIGQHVIKSIVEADLIVADLTGHNPNVFYELAIAHGYRKPVVHLITDGESIPFDINDQRTIKYDLTDPASVDAAISALRTSSTAAMANPEELITPLSSFEMFATLRASSDPDKGAGDVIADALERIAYRLSSLEARLDSPNDGRFDLASRIDAYGVPYKTRLFDTETGEELVRHGDARGARKSDLKKLNPAELDNIPLEVLRGMAHEAIGGDNPRSSFDKLNRNELRRLLLHL